MSMETLRCPKCGSSDTSSVYWVNNKTNEIDECFAPRYDSEHNFCESCQERTKLVTLTELWEEFSNIPIDNDDNIKRPFLNFEAGTSRFDVWHWFDERCPNGLAKDLAP